MKFESLYNVFKVFFKQKLPWVWSKDGESNLLQFVEGGNNEYTYEAIYMNFKNIK